MKPCEQPNYTAILMDLQKKDATIGLGRVNWGDFTHLNQEKTQLIELFNSHFGLREVGAETMGRWLFLLQKRFDEIKRDYEHRFAVLHTYADKMDDLGRTIEVKKEYGKVEDVTDTITYGETNESKFQDTPVTPLGESEYVTNITNDKKGGSDTDVSNKKYTGMDKETKTDNTEMYIKEMNTLINEYNDVSMKFVNEFESCFMSTIMRV